MPLHTPERPATARPVNGPQNVERFGRQLDETNTTFRQRGEAANRLRLQFLAARLHALGPLFHFLGEIEAGADVRGTLEEYAALPAEFIRTLGGDWPFPTLGGGAG
jgi:hypothetical protein